MAASEIWKLGAGTLAARIRTGDVGVLEAVTSTLARIDAVNPRLNALVARMDQRALRRAAELDKATAKGDAPGPLHGVPVTIKVNIDQAGEATTNGLIALKDAIAPGDSPVVSALERAGAVVVGRSNTPEFSFRAETDNPLHGLTRNPWGDHVSCGGSSGGAGAAVMAGMGALAHGNDIAGSLRFPASACGGVTVKPGVQRVPGWNPGARGDRAMLGGSMAVQGLIVREARDLHLAMPVMIEAHPGDPYHAPLPWRGPELEGPKRIGYTEACFGREADADVLKALRAARAALEDAGYELEEITPPGFPSLGETAFRALLTENAVMYGRDFETYGSAEMQRIWRRYLALYPPFDFPGFLAAQGQRQAWAREWSFLLDRFPLVLTPFLPAPFPRQRFDLDESSDPGLLESAHWSFSMNFLGLPAGNVPAHLAETAAGPVPVGVQIIGRRWREDLIVDAMIEIEDRLGQMAPRLWAQSG